MFQQSLGVYICPHVEYAIQVWQPWLKRDLTDLEIPQRRAYVIYPTEKVENAWSIQRTMPTIARGLYYDVSDSEEPQPRVSPSAKAEPQQQSERTSL